MKINNIHDFHDAEALIWDVPGLPELYGEFRKVIFATQVRLHNVVVGNTQGSINDALKGILRELGWQDWVPNPKLPNNKSDFRKVAVENEIYALGAEVQFGNMAKVSDDLTKLNFGVRNKLIDVALLVIPSRDMARLLDENLPPFDRVVRELEERQQQFKFLRVMILEVSHDGLVDTVEPRRRPRVKGGRGYTEDKAQPQITIDRSVLA